MAEPEFAALQSRLRSFWPTVTLRSIGEIERTVVVVHSLSFSVPDHLIPVFPAYEERCLCLVLSLLRAPRSRVVYVTSQPIHPRVLDYYFALVPELDTPEARSRFTIVLAVLLGPVIAIGFLPESVGEYLEKGSLMAAGLALQQTVDRPDNIALAPSEALAVVAAYAVGTLVLALWLIARRDA